MRFSFPRFANRDRWFCHEVTLSIRHFELPKVVYFYISRLINGDSECQYKNPWEIQDLDIERVRLFNKAIQLRKEFILASKKIRSNIKMLFHLWGYKDKDANDIFFSEDTKYEIFDDLFQTLFLIVPVVSTTFASV